MPGGTGNSINKFSIKKVKKKAFPIMERLLYNELIFNAYL